MSAGAQPARTHPQPRVCVLMATHDGLPWLGQQIDSILGQTGVEVELLVSDDQSSDGTWEWLQERAAREARIVLLPRTRRFGSAAANFYRLLGAADTRRFPLFAFADQDDIWRPGKLARQAEILEQQAVDGVSSNVVAFWPTGRRKLIRKAQPQRRFDYLFEPPGPGCSFLMRASLVEHCVALLAALSRAGVEPLPKHDWLVYLVARRGGGRWFIDDLPSLDYRQHGRNEVGANVGLRAVLRRLQALWRGDFRDLVRHAIEMARVVDQLHGRSDPLHLNAWQILREGRRSRLDGLVAAAFMLRGVGASSVGRSREGAGGRLPDTRA